MKAIGATNRDIRKLFFWESALIGILGGILGVVIALLFDAGFNFVINLLIKSKGQHLDFFVVPINFSFIIIIFAVLISIFSGLYPTIRAQKLSPIDALRQ
jgi:putative ABC transport system permease protein